MLWLVVVAVASRVAGETLSIGLIADRSNIKLEAVFHFKRALKHVEESGVLNGTRLKLDFVFRETLLQNQHAMAATLELGQRPDVIGIVGSPERQTAEAIAQVGSLLAKPVLSTEASSPKLIDKSDMPFFFRSISSDGDRIKMAVALCAHFNWLRVAALTSDNEDGYAKAQLTKDQLAGIGGTLATSVYYALGADGQVDLDRFDEAIRALEVSGCRVTIFFGDPDDRHEVVYALAQAGMGDMQFVHIGFPSRETEFLVDGAVSLDPFMRGWLFIGSVVSDVTDHTGTDRDEVYPARWEGAGLTDRYYDDFQAETTPWDCAAMVGVDPFALNVNATDTIYDVTMFSGYPDAGGLPVSSWFPLCAGGDGLPYNFAWLGLLNKGFYDAAWIFALAIRRMVAADATVDDIRTDGAWLMDKSSRPTGSVSADARGSTPSPTTSRKTPSSRTCVSHPTAPTNSSTSSCRPPPTRRARRVPSGPSRTTPVPSACRRSC